MVAATVFYLIWYYILSDLLGWWDIRKCTKSEHTTEARWTEKREEEALQMARCSCGEGNLSYSYALSCTASLQWWIRNGLWTSFLTVYHIQAVMHCSLAYGWLEVNACSLHWTKSINKSQARWWYCLAEIGLNLLNVCQLLDLFNIKWL